MQKRFLAKDVKAKSIEDILLIGKKTIERKGRAPQDLQLSTRLRPIAFS